MRQKFRRLLSLGLALCLTLPAVSYAQIPNSSSSDSLNPESEISELVTSESVTPEELAAREQAKQKLFEITKEKATKLEDGTRAWSEEQENLVPLLLSAAEKLEAEAQRIINLHGEKYLADLIEKNQFAIDYQEADMQVMYRVIGNQRVPRILYKDEVYILVDEHKLPRDSAELVKFVNHYNQYISRTHHDSGGGRVVRNSDGEIEKTIFGNNRTTIGRNLSVVFLNDGKSDGFYLPKAKPTSWQWWKEYFYAKYKKPTLNDFALAMVTGSILQGGLTLAATYAKHAISGEPMIYSPVYWAMGYSLFIGTFMSTYQNWVVNNGSRLTRVLKAQPASALFAVGLVMCLGHGSFTEKAAAISIFSSVGRSKMASIFVNGLMNNYAKDYWSQIRRIRDVTGLDRGEIDLGKYPFTDTEIKWKKSNISYPLLYLFPWSINMISLMLLSGDKDHKNPFQIPGTDITVPILQFIGIPAAMWISKWYSREVAEKEKLKPDAEVNAREVEALAAKYEAAWAKLIDFKSYPRRLYQSCAKLLKISAY
jgi:hypothetical protein